MKMQINLLTIIITIDIIIKAIIINLSIVS